ncbi:MAG: TolC family protein [Xanthomonadales bacterium]|nr:TolC family protein [Xanthomonadales bacterium]
MRWQWTALCAAAGWLLAVSAHAQSSNALPTNTTTRPTASIPSDDGDAILTLDAALQRVIEIHPELRALRQSDAALAAEIEHAGQRPARRLELDLENGLGTGAASALDGSELTLALSSLIERGGKRQARIAVAEGQRELLLPQLQARELDLLGEVALRWLDAAAAAARADLAEQAAAERATLAEATRQRARAGALPRSVPLSAQAARQRSLAEAAQARRQAQAERRRMALLWGGAEEALALAPVDFSVLPVVPDRAAVLAAAGEHPQLRRLDAEERLREARLRLAQGQARADLEWRLGVRWLGDGNDWGLVGSLSLPLGSATRAAPAIRARAMELETLALEREAQVLSLNAMLGEVWAQLDEAVALAQALDHDVLPLLREAEAESARTFAAGASSYLEWAQLQAERLQLQAVRLAAAVDAQRAWVELQRLTGRGRFEGLGMGFPAAMSPAKRSLEAKPTTPSAAITEYTP